MTTTVPARLEGKVEPETQVTAVPLVFTTVSVRLDLHRLLESLGMVVVKSFWPITTSAAC